MDCSSILQDLSDFDTNAPISVSILFEDSDEFEDIKTENIVIDQNTDNTIHLSDITRKSNTEIQDKPISTPNISDEIKIKTEKAEESIFEELDSFSSQSIDNNKPISEESRKRKQVQLQICHNNKKPCPSSMNEPNNQSSHVLETASESEIIKSTSDDPRAEISCMAKSNPQLPSVANSVKNSTETNTHFNNLSPHIKGCLLTVSDRMRIIMEAYYHHKRYKLPESDFILMKNKLFNLSYSTVVTMLLPEEKNIDFLRTFLTETYRHACKTPSIYKRTYKDYVVLLKELLKWTKDNKSIIDKSGYLPVKMTVLQTNNHNINHTELNSPIEQNALNSNTAQASFQCTAVAKALERIVAHELRKSPKSTTDENKICIFSAGSRGNEISINVDPTLKKYVSNIPANNSLEIRRLDASIERRQSQITDKRNTRVETELIKQLRRPPSYSKYHNEEQSFERSVIPQPGNIPNSTNIMSTCQINTSHHMQIGLPQIQRPSEIQQVQTISQQLRQFVPQYGNRREILPQYRHPTNFSPQYGPTRHVQSSHLQPQSWQLQVGQQQSKQSNPTIQASVWRVSQALPQYEQQQQRDPPPYGQIYSQQQFGQQQHLLPQMQSQNMSPQIYGASNYMPAQYGQTQSGLPRYGAVSGQPQNRQPVKPQFENSLDWHQQLQQQTQTQIRGSPRSVSTDSGFISPLNFVPSDQTIPPQGTEANLLITHVTSLNPKVAYIDDGKCVVCKKPTKQVCMGCMLCYYCSYECQLADWSSHEPNCKVNK